MEFYLSWSSICHLVLYMLHFAHKDLNPGFQISTDSNMYQQYGIGFWGIEYNIDLIPDTIGQYFRTDYYYWWYWYKKHAWTKLLYTFFNKYFTMMPFALVTFVFIKIWGNVGINCLHLYMYFLSWSFIYHVLQYATHCSYILHFG